MMMMTIRPTKNDYDRVYTDEPQGQHGAMIDRCYTAADDGDEPSCSEHVDGDDDFHQSGGDASGGGRGGGGNFSSSSNSILEHPGDDDSRSCCGLRRPLTSRKGRQRRIASAGSPPGQSYYASFPRVQVLVGVVVIAVTAAASVAVMLAWAGLFDDRSVLITLRNDAGPSSYSLSLPNGITTESENDNELIGNLRPPLHELIGDFDTNVTGNVSFLLDFALIGHSKCATTSHLRWLRSHPDVLMDEHEVHSLARNRPAELVSVLYALPNRPNRKRRYKSPVDVMRPTALRQLRTHWPNAKLVIGVRHPVLWFESYYNFQKRQHDLGISPAANVVLPPAENMSVPFDAYYHHHLRYLGKTNGSDPHERALLGDDTVHRPPYMSSKVFLYESTQPFDDDRDDGRSAQQYRHDLATFLELSLPLDPIPVRGAPNGEPYHYSNSTSTTTTSRLNVCDDKYASLRHRLLEIGTMASEWVLQYFVTHPDVTVSCPRRFEELVRT